MGVKDLKSKAHVYVSGKVQGVFFRAYISEKAKSLGVSGWARNLSDGRVETVFQGNREDIDKMIDFCRQGPVYAQVDGVEVIWEKPSGESRRFEVLPTI